jgi:hypothetical protein
MVLQAMGTDFLNINQQRNTRILTEVASSSGASGHVHSNIADIVAIQRQVSLEPGAQYSQVDFFLIP